MLCYQLSTAYVSVWHPAQWVRYVINGDKLK